MSDSSTPPQNSVGPSTCSVIMRADAQDAMDRHMSDDTAIEYGGVLVGTADPLIGLVIVTAHEPLPDSDSAETVTFTRETWDQMTRVVMSRHPGQRIVGWYHSHPRFGIFLSAHDLAIQTTYFSQPWQVAYVFDPVQHERGLFGWSNYEIVRIPAWEVATSTLGIVTSAPAHVPAHGEYITARLADEAVVASAASAELASNPAAAVASPPVFSAPVAGGAPMAGSSPVGGKKSRSAKWAVLAVIALVAGAAIAFLLNRDDDAGSASTTTSLVSESTAAPTDITKVQATTTVVPSTEASAVVTDAPTTTADSVVTSSEPETSTSIAVLATPATVTAPSARVADGTQPCDAASNGSYSPTTNCFVALNNGNVLSFADGELSCTDPAGATLGAATSFTVGIDDDPLVILADDALVPKCGDVTYARNVLAGGASTLDGLCGSANTAINDASLRCFSQNPTTGAMAALVAGSGSSIAGSCSNGAAGPTVAPLTWSKGTVDVSWRIVSLLWDADKQLFEASATRDGVPTTATFSCA